MKRPRASLKAVVVLALGLLAAQAPALAVDFVPERVFAGRSAGEGELKLLFRQAQVFTVESRGTERPDGTFQLDQTIRFSGQPARVRSWVMRRSGPGTYSATLTDAAGPVAARIDGPRMTLRVPLTHWGLIMHQTLEVADDGRTIDNRGRIRLLGVPFGRLRETIRLGL